MEYKEFAAEIVSMESFLQNFAFKLTGNKGKAEDLVQETMLKALINADKYERGSIKGWLGLVMKRIFLDANRAKQSRPQVQHIEGSLVFGESEDGFVEIEAKHMLEEVYKILKTLSDDMRRPLELFVYGYSYIEITDITGVSLSVVKSQIFRARKEIFDKLGAEIMN